MDFIGEHLWPGRLGHLFLILSLVCSIGATVCYFIATSVKHNIQYSFRTSVLKIFLGAGLLSIADRVVAYFSGVKHFGVLDNTAGNVIFALFDIALVLFLLGTIANYIGITVYLLASLSKHNYVYHALSLIMK